MTNDDLLDLMEDTYKKYPKAIIHLRRVIEERGLEYADNFRVALAADAWQKTAYEFVRRTGCCGYLEEEVVIDGELFWIGCNYGH